jgi:hypothetical protein
VGDVIRRGVLDRGVGVQRGDRLADRDTDRELDRAFAAAPCEPHEHLALDERSLGVRGRSGERRARRAGG